MITGPTIANAMVYKLGSNSGNVIFLLPSPRTSDDTKVCASFCAWLTEKFVECSRLAFCFVAAIDADAQFVLIRIERGLSL